MGICGVSKVTRVAMSVKGVLSIAGQRCREVYVCRYEYSIRRTAYSTPDGCVPGFLLLRKIIQLNRGDMFVQDATDERLTRLCQQAASEQDAERLIELVGEINDLLEEKRARDQERGRVEG
jgi:hypothetical protein